MLIVGASSGSRSEASSGTTPRSMKPRPNTSVTVAVFRSTVAIALASCSATYAVALLHRDVLGLPGGRAGELVVQDRAERIAHGIVELNALERVEVGRAHVVLRRSRDGVGQRDDSDGSLGVAREVVGRLALVRDDGVRAVGRHRHHVGEGSDRHLAEHRRLIGVGIEEQQAAGRGLVVGVLESDDAEAVVADRDGVRDAARCADLVELGHGCRVGHVDREDAAGVGIHGEESVSMGLHDLARAGIEDPGLERARDG